MSPTETRGNEDPFERFLDHSPVFQEFVKDVSGNLLPKEISNRAVRRLQSQNGDNGIYYDLPVSTARFLMGLDTSFENPGVNITYPSRLTRIDPNEIHPFITCLIDTAYPQRGYTPSVALVGNGREVRLDLTKYWDGKTYELSLTNSSLSAVIYYLCLPFNMPASLPSVGSRDPDFIYGFRQAGSDWQEFIQMSYNQAMYNGRELAREFIPRNNGYLGGNLIQDAEELAKAIREICQAHPQKTIRFN